MFIKILFAEGVYADGVAKQGGGGTQASSLMVSDHSSQDYGKCGLYLPRVSSQKVQCVIVAFKVLLDLLFSTVLVSFSLSEEILHSLLK